MIMQGNIGVGFPNTTFGIGAVQDIGRLVNNLGKKEVLVVTDQGIVQAGLLDKIKEPLEAERINFLIFDECEPDAPVANILKCAEIGKENSYDLLIGIGGGSVMDITKVVAIIATDDTISQENISKYISSGIPKRGIPTILIPTTAGTGSEVSIAAVMTGDDGRKKTMISNNLLPEVAIVDPLMTLNLPAKITADSGMDALSHAVEGYTNANANVFSEMYAEKVIEIVASNLRTAYCKGPQNIEARYKMAVAASMGSLSLSAARGSMLIHGMGYVIQAEAHCTHGESCTLMMPHVMEFNMTTNLSKYARMAELMGEKIDGLSPKDAARKASDAIRNLTSGLNMPQRLKDIGIQKDCICRMTDNLFTSYSNNIKNNPRECSKEEAIKIFQAAW